MNRPSIGFTAIEEESQDGNLDEAISVLKSTKGRPRAPSLPAEDVKAAAMEAGFQSREAPRRGLTGRNKQVNIKTTAEAKARLYALADAQGVPLGKVLEDALLALEAQLESV